jgi:hypothetical protein
MRRSCLGIAGVLLASALAGCGEPSEEGPKPFKETELSPPIKQLMENQNKNVIAKPTTSKPEEKPAPKKDPEKKPAGDAAADKKN